MKEKFQKLMEKLSTDEQLMEKLLTQETPEEAQGVLKEAGHEFSMEEIVELRDIMLSFEEASNNGELSEEDLEKIAGGGIWDDVKRPWVQQYGPTYRLIRRGIRRIRWPRRW